MTTTEQDSGIAVSATTAPPATLPALRQWTAGTGQGFQWTPAARIVVDSTFAPALAADAQTFSGDLALALNAAAPAVLTGASDKAVLGDIHIALGATDDTLGAEGYVLTVGPILQIGARAAAGAFWATRTVLQMLRQSPTLPPGSTRDVPQYPVRSVLVDNAGRAFPIGFWHNEIRELSYLKLNELMVYAPGLGLTDAQLQDLGKYAAAYHVNLVGQVNMPGHMDTAREGIPGDFELTDRSGAPIPGALDLTNPAAVTWARQLTAHYIGLFPAPIWHTGGDEYAFFDKKMNDPTDLPKLAAYAVKQFGPKGTIEDVYRAFMNDTNAQAKQQGKSLRMWNDDLFASSGVALDSDITVEYWLGGGLTPAQLAANGNQLVNADASTLYYDEHAGGTFNTTGQIIWEVFDPGTFQGGGKLPGGATDPHLSGVKLSSWDVAHEDVGRLESDLQPLQRALSQRAWGSPKLFPAWAQMTPTAAAVGRAPGFFDTPAAGDPGATSLPSAKAVMFKQVQNTFTVQPDGSVLHSYCACFAGGKYTTELVAPAGSAVGQPTAYTSGNQQHVFARGADGHLHHWVTGRVFGGWVEDDWTAKAAAHGPSLDLAGDPSGFLYGTEQHVFGRGSNGRLHHWVYSALNNTVSANDWGGAFTGNPAAVVFGRAQCVFARGTDGTLRQWWWQPSDPGYVHQSQWPGALLAADASPAAMDYTETQLHVFARDTAGHLRHWWYDQVAGTNAVEDWTAQTGFSIAGNPSGFVYGDQQHVFFRDATTNHLDHIWNTQGRGLGHDDWSATTPGGVTALAGDPWSYNVLGSEQQVFGFDAAGHVHHWFWRQSDNTLHQDTWQR